jgi:signal recognition particle GTPase
MDDPIKELVDFIEGEIRWREELREAFVEAGIGPSMTDDLVEALAAEERDDRTAKEVVADELASWSPGDSEKGGEE